MTTAHQRFSFSFQSFCQNSELACCTLFVAQARSSFGNVVCILYCFNLPLNLSLSVIHNQSDVKTSPKTAQTPKIPGCGNGTLLPGGDGGGSQRRYKFRLVGSTAPSNTFIANKSITIPPGTLDPSSRSPCRRLTHFRLTQVPKVPFLAQNRENCSICAPSGKRKPPRPGISSGFRKQPGLLPSPCVH